MPAEPIFGSCNPCDLTGLAYLEVPEGYGHTTALIPFGAPDQSALTAPTGGLLNTASGARLRPTINAFERSYPGIVIRPMFTDTSSCTVSALSLFGDINNNPYVVSTTSSAGTLAPPDSLDGFGQYATDNWDGYGAQAITAETIAAARRFIRAMPVAYGPPDVAPGNDATIGLEWYFSNRPIRKLFIDIGPGGVWKGFCRKASGEHRVFPDTPMAQDLRNDLARRFRALEA
jgi:hypothetical protein